MTTDCSRAQKIEFRDMNNWDKTILSWAVAPQEPWNLYSVSPTILLYSDSSTYPSVVHWLDSSEKEPEVSYQCYESVPRVPDNCSWNWNQPSAINNSNSGVFIFSRLGGSNLTKVFLI